MRAWLVCLAVTATLVAGCGAKTGLLLPDAAATADVPMDLPDVTDVTDVTDVCAPTTQGVERLVAEVIFVIDRSGSMDDPTPSGLSRWNALSSALATVLPAVDTELWTGLVQFPSQVPGTAVSECGGPMALDLAPRPRDASRVLAALRGSRPLGGTPTFDALTTAGRYYDTTPSPGQVRGRYLVLATDGGPNCNPALETTGCMCTNPRGCRGMQGLLSCLDDVRTESVLRSLAARGYPTFVIGIPGADVVSLEPTLEALALAGGRPRSLVPGEHRYYRVDDADGFVTAFRDITTAVVRCHYVTDPLPAPDRAAVLVSGMAVTRDSTHAAGWDWANTMSGEFVLYGPACDAAVRPGATVTVRANCPGP